MLRTISKKRIIDKCDSSLATRQTGILYLNKQIPKMKKQFSEKETVF